MPPRHAVERHLDVAGRILAAVEIAVVVHDHEFVIDVGARQHLLAALTVVDVDGAVGVDLADVAPATVHDHLDCIATVDRARNGAGNPPLRQVEHDQAGHERHGHDSEVALARDADDGGRAESCA